MVICTFQASNQSAPADYLANPYCSSHS